MYIYFVYRDGIEVDTLMVRIVREFLGNRNKHCAGVITCIFPFVITNLF